MASITNKKFTATQHSGELTTEGMPEIQTRPRQARDFIGLLEHPSGEVDLVVDEGCELLSAHGFEVAGLDHGCFASPIHLACTCLGELPGVNGRFSAGDGQSDRTLL